jgi:uncharacterized membrane-anchored protein
MIARFTWRAALLVLTLATTLGLAPARAEGDEFDARGPAKVQIGKDLATLNLPKGYVYFGEAKARALMEQMGSGDKDVLAFIMPDQKEANFGILIGFDRLRQGRRRGKNRRQSHLGELSRRHRGSE